MKGGYADALRWLLGLTNLESKPLTRATREEMGLDRVAALVERLGSPQRNYRTVLVAGSKGKGSTAVTLASILAESGLLTGLYSQPHLHTYRERIRVDGSLISESEFTAEAVRVKIQAEALLRELPTLGACTTFEVATAMALDYFARAQVDVAVIEVGLGGRLDATNIVEAGLSIITPISLEHTAVLGNSLTEIAGEKAGIIKAGRPLLCGPQKPEAMEVLAQAAAQCGSPLGVAGREWNLRQEPEGLRVAAQGPCAGLWTRAWRHEGLRVALKGAHQLENAAIAVAAAEVLREQDGLRIGGAAIKKGIEKVRWPGRTEVARTEGPTVVLDGAHNGDSALRLAAVLRTDFTYERLILVLGVLRDKDLAALIAPLAPPAQQTYAVRTRQPRSRDDRALAEELRSLGIEATAGGTVGEGLEKALAQSGARDLVCVTGSLSTVAEAREYLGLVSEQERDPGV